MGWDHKCPDGRECLNAGDICDGGWLCCRDDIAKAEDALAEPGERISLNDLKKKLGN